MKKLALIFIRWYQVVLSPDTGVVGKTLIGSACRYTPTCSEYVYGAISRYGIIKGSFLSVKRILRCHPWTRGGYDPLP